MSLRIEERSVSKANLKPGMLIRFGYTKADNTSGVYSLLVVDPNRTSERSRSPQLHGYNVDGMDDTDIINFLVELKYPIVLDPKRRELRLPQMSISDAYDSLKSAVSLDRPYRIFTLENVGTINQVFVELPDEIVDVVINEVTISNKISKSNVLEFLTNNDFESLRKVPEIEKAIQTGVGFKKSEK